MAKEPSGQQGKTTRRTHRLRVKSQAGEQRRGGRGRGSVLDDSSMAGRGLERSTRAVRGGPVPPGRYRSFSCSVARALGEVSELPLALPGGIRLAVAGA